MRFLTLCLIGSALAATSLAADQDGSFDRSLSVSGPVSLDVKTDSGGISIVPGSASTVQIHAILKAQRGWLGASDAQSRIRQLEQHPPIEQNGNSLRIGYVRDPNLLKGISMRFEIRTPAETQVLAHADSGGIQVEGVRGPVDVNTDSGGIQVRDVKSEVRATADSGGIRLDQIAGPVTAHVDSGGIRALNVAGSVDAKADSGRIEISQTKAAPIRAHADSGGVSVQLAPNAGYNLNVATDSGGLSVPQMTVKSSFSKHHIEGEVAGGGPLVELRVSSGGIRVE